MKKTADQRIAEMTFASVYPHYVNKVEKKGRTEAELQAVIEWLTSFGVEKQKELLETNQTFEEMFAQADLHPKAIEIKGKICGQQIEEIQHPLTLKVRYLDKLVDELAKGKTLEKILRS